jgi:hypothetical protein
MIAAQQTAARNGSALDPMLSSCERSVLSYLMRDRRACEELCHLSTEDFCLPTHRIAFRAITDVFAEGQDPNELVVTNRLRVTKNLDSVGGAAQVTSIASETTSESIVKYSLDYMREASSKRNAAKIGEQLKNGEINLVEARERLSKLGEPPRGWLDIIDSATVNSDELASLKLAPRLPLLGEWLCEGDYGIIYAPRGTGKTFFALLIAKAVSAGGHIGEWRAPGCAKVLYIDGEMPADLMRDRDRGLGSGNVEFLNHEILFDRKEKVLNITDPQLQHAILGRCIRNGIKLVVLDNLSRLASGVKENDSYDWEQLHNWLLQFRRHRIAVILVHHAGRNGQPRGTSKREDAAFWVIALDDTKKQADDKRGAHFISRFTKPSRNTQEEIPPFEWHIVTDPMMGEISVACKAAHSMDVFRKWIEDGVTECGQLAAEMNVSPGTISKWAKKGEREGWLRKQNREYMVVEGNGGQ